MSPKEIIQNAIPDVTDEVERSAALYDKETEEKLAAEKVNPIPKSTYLKDLYSDFIEEELDTMRHHQMCDVYLVETRIYLEKSIEDLKGLRESYETYLNIIKNN